MRNEFSVGIRAGFLFTAVCCCLFGRSQSVPAPKIETPNVASMEKFGDIPVDLSTGTPNIEIPIHTLHYGSINVPISLRYHSGSVRVSQHPGWMGLGWDLQSGGVITRAVREYTDEYYGSTIMPSGLSSTYYPEPIASPPVSGSEIVNNATNWGSSSTLATYFEANGNGQLSDVSADEFSFNFMGHSGKFYYSGPTLGWQVACDENIRVQLTNAASPFLTGGAVYGTINSLFSTTVATGHLFPGSGNIPTNGPQVFSGFTLTVPDGTKYYFGGVDANGNGTGIEFHAQYGINAIPFLADTWLLTKIVDVDNNEVDFNYSASYPIADLGFGFSANSQNCQPTNGDFLNTSHIQSYSSALYVNTHSGTLSLPLYLDNITSPNESITFNRSVSNACLRFPENMYRKINPINPPDYASGLPFALNILGDGTPDGHGNLINGVNNLQWEQLNNITIANANHQSYRQYTFNYSNDASQRLALNGVQELDNLSTAVEGYSFVYNNISALPLYDADYSDHWGFYNGVTVASANTALADASAGSIYSCKQTNASLATTGLLSQIHYPTGGYTAFTWQAHDYSQVVSNARNALNSQTGYAGGVRISEIKSYQTDGTLARDKKYLYIRGYANGNPNYHSSSGILNGTPTYNMSLTNRTTVGGAHTFSVTVSQLNSLAVYSYNSQASYIGYDEVVELNEDGSYTRNFFTSYGPDLNGTSHWDVQPVASLGWITGDNYYTLSNLDMERGKPVGAFKYTANDILVQKTLTTYRNDAGRLNNYIRLINFNGLFSCTAYDALVLATENQIFTYSYYPVTQTTTNYDQTGANPVTTSVTYQYNTNNLLSVKSETGSQGETIVTSYSYPPDMTDATSQAMTAAHILNPVMQTSVSVTRNSVSNFINSSKTNYYTPSTGRYKPQNVQIQISSNPIETRQQFYAYDTYGNIQELSKTNDIHEVYLWGYFGQYPVAKITGSTFSAVSALVSQAQINAVTNTTTATNDITVRSLLQTLRTGLPNALVTTYTYLPLTGITSETDPRGQTTYYQYDAFQRLILITDNDGNVLKRFTYGYLVP